MSLELKFGFGVSPPHAALECSPISLLNDLAKQKRKYQIRYVFLFDYVNHFNVNISTAKLKLFSFKITSLTVKFEPSGSEKYHLKTEICQL